MKKRPLLLVSASALLALSLGLALKAPHRAEAVAANAGRLSAESIGQTPATPQPAKSGPQQATLASTTQVTEEAKISIGAQIRVAEYWFTARIADDKVGEGIAAPNRGQQMTVHFDQHGLTLTPWTKDGEADWSFQVTAVSAGAPTAEKGRALYGDGEWFENSAKGIEHGMTLEQPGSDPSQPLVLTFPVRTDLLGQAGSNNQLLFKDAAGRTQLRYEQLDAFDADGMSIPTELAWNDQTQEITWTIAHQGHAYPLTIDPLITRAAGKLVASDGAAGDQFGTSVSLSGDTLAVGAPSSDIGTAQDQGAVYLFTRNQSGPNAWGEVKKLAASDGSTSDLFGSSVSLAGDTLAIGAAADGAGGTGNQGSVTLFARNQGGANQWGKVKKLTASSGTVKFGSSVSLAGDSLAIGAPSDEIGANLGQGSVTLFTRNQGGENQWGKVKKLTASDGAAGDHFGISVSLTDDALAVGASYDTVGTNFAQGSAYVFARNQGGADQWGEVRRLIASDGAAGDRLGVSVSLSGDTLAAGAYTDHVNSISDQGSVTLFCRNQGGTNQWGELKKITASDGGAADYFGDSVSLSGDTLAVGAWDDRIGTNGGQGSVILFARNQGGANQWGEVNKLISSDGAADDRFGYSVSFSGDTLAVGTYLDSAGANSYQGSVTLFDRTQSQWTRADVVSPPTAPAITVKEFSAATAATPDTLVVGAPDSHVVALGGANVGRAYVFTAAQGTVNSNWTLQAVLQPTWVETGSRFGSSVAIIPGFIAVGAPGDDGNRGQAHLFALNQGGAGNWGEIKRLQGTVVEGMAAGPRFGAAVALSADAWWAIGAPGAPAGGQVTLHERNTGGADNWGLVRTLTYTSPFSPDLPEAAEFGAALAMEGTRIVVGAPGGTGRRSFLSTLLPNAGLAFVHEKDSGGLNTWGQVARLSEFVKGTGITDGRFGTSVVLNGDWAAATQPGQANALVFHRDDLTDPAQWGRIQRFEGTQAIALSTGIVAVSRNTEAAVETYRRDPAADFTWKSFSLVRDNDVTAATGFGRSLALAGESLFVAAPQANAGQGQLHLYGRQQQDYREITRQIASTGAMNDRLGASVALSGDTLAVGAPLAVNGHGAVYLFSKNQGGASGWGEVKKLTSSDGATGDFFGNCLSLAGDTLAVGVPYDDVNLNTDQGSVCVFSRNQGGAGGWGQVRKLSASDGAAADYFGISVSLEGDTLAVGVPYDDNSTTANQGSVILFARNQGGADQWGRVALCSASNGATNDYFGWSVSLAGDTLAVGAIHAAVGAISDQGAVTLFARNQGGANQWGKVTTLSASDGATGDYFGYSVSLSGDTLAVAAIAADIGGNIGQGSVTLFTRNQGGANQWGELRKLTASNGATNDAFGTSVSLSEDTLAVGIEADGIGTSFMQGSVTLFARNQGGANQWGELQKFTASDGTDNNLFGSAVSLAGDTLAVGSEADDVGTNGAQGSVYLFRIDRSRYDEWILEQFGAISVTNPGLEAAVWGDLADPDGDGLQNLAEAYLGLNPLIADTPPQSMAAVEGSMFTYRWQRAAEYRGIQAIPTWSTDLQSWYRSGSGPVGDIRSITLTNRGPLLSNNHDALEATLPTTGAGKTFLRLEFTR